MKRALMYVLIGLLIVIVGIETVFIINQHSIINQQTKTIDSQKSSINAMKEKEHTKLAEKVITHTYNEFQKTEKLSISRREVVIIDSNIDIISDSYSGDDADIKDMLTKVKKYISYTRLNYSKIYPSEETDEINEYMTQSISMQIDANKAVDICISKYALFDKIGLYK